jgi:hypothetical protein
MIGFTIIEHLSSIMIVKSLLVVGKMLRRIGVENRISV